jgi:putative ABC transport system permease protein
VFSRFPIVALRTAAWPPAYSIMNRWPQDFAYCVDLGFRPFFPAGLAAVLIAMVTVSARTIRAGLINPIESLRRE